MALKDRYYTISDVAETVGVTRQTVSRWIKQNKLKAEKIGRESLIERDILFNFLDARPIPQLLDYEMTQAFKYYFEEKHNIASQDKVDRIGSALEFAITKKDGSRKTILVDVFETIYGIQQKDNKDVVYLGIIINKLTDTTSKHLKKRKKYRKVEKK